MQEEKNQEKLLRARYATEKIYNFAAQKGYKLPAGMVAVPVLNHIPDEGKNYRFYVIKSVAKNVEEQVCFCFDMFNGNLSMYPATLFDPELKPFISAPFSCIYNPDWERYERKNFELRSAFSYTLELMDPSGELFSLQNQRTEEMKHAAEILGFISSSNEQNAKPRSHRLFFEPNSRAKIATNTKGKKVYVL
ncbi:hypothetical protein EOM81_13180, partial [bacterium]|nr:hypothetical protein [bacterium]